MSGYSGTPPLKKLGIKDGDRVLVVNPPRNLPDELRAFAEKEPKRDIDVVVLFAMSRTEFRSEFAKATKKIQPDGMIWIAWPKRASGIKTDLTEDVIRNFALEGIFVDVKVCAIDQTWSGLKLVIRKELRSARAAKA
ncbi:MAG TPA: DUF3052 domain-containing protein [Terriglobales bacterium]